MELWIIRSNVFVKAIFKFMYLTLAVVAGCCVVACAIIDSYVPCLEALVNVILMGLTGIIDEGLG